MKAISNAIKGVNYHNPQLAESLYELCRRATSRHIDGPDEILNQQVVYMINSEMHTPYAAKDAAMCLKRRLQMDHPQKQYLGIILTSKVLQECHAAIGIYQGELLQEVAYILRTVRSSGPASARTRQVAMDVLRHFGSAGGDAYRNARQLGGPPAAATGSIMQARDPAAIAAERASLLDEIKRMCEQASASTEILNELTLNKDQGIAGTGTADDAAGLRKELLVDVRDLRKLFDQYMEQLAALQGPDAEEAMKAALEAVDNLDNALTLEKDVDAELKGMANKKAEAGTTEPAKPAEPERISAVVGASASDSMAATSLAANKMQSLNLIDLDESFSAPAGVGGPGTVDPFAPKAVHISTAAAAADPFASTGASADPFAPAAAAQPRAAADPFAPVTAATAAAPAAADPFAALAAAPGTGAAGVGNPPPQAAAAAPAAATADPFTDAIPSWQMPSSSPAPAAAASAAPAQLPTQQQQQQQQLPSQGAYAGATGGGFVPSYGGTPTVPGYGGMQVSGMPAVGYGYGYTAMPGYGMPGQVPAGYGVYSPQLTGQYTPQATGQYTPQTTGQYGYPQQQQIPLLQQPQQQQQAYGVPAATSGHPSAVGFGGRDGAAGSSPSNPFAAVAPVAAATAAVNPFGQPAAASAGGAGNVEQEWNTFFADRK